MFHPEREAVEGRQAQQKLVGCYICHPEHEAVKGPQAQHDGLT